jgi:hypothetical protein
MTDEVRVVTVVEARPVVTALGLVQQVGVNGPDVTIGNNGIVVRTGLGAYVARTLASAAAALTIANPDGVAAAPTFNLSTELQAVAALGTTGYVKRTGVATWSASASVPYADLSGVPSTFTPSAHTHPWSDVTGTPTTATGYGIVSIDAIPVGATTASTGNFTTIAANGKIAHVTGNTAATAVRLGSMTLVGLATSAAVYADGAIPAAVTTRASYFAVVANTANNAVAYGTIVGYDTGGLAAWSLGGTSTASNAIGFWASNSITGMAATNRYGFYSDINDAATTYQFYGAGSATSVLSGPLNFLTPTTGKDVLLRIGASGSAHPSTANTTYVAYMDLTVAATSTTQYTGFNTVLRTAAAAFTINNLHHFRAQTTSLGAGSAVTTVYGFVAENTLAVGANNYGFYSNINDASGTFQLNMAGTAPSRFSGPVGISSGTVSTNGVLFLALSAAATNTSLTPVAFDFTAPATATSAMSCVFGTVRTAATAFTIPEINGYRLNQFLLGAGSAVTNLNGYYVFSAFTNDVAACTVRGFYSLLNRGVNATVYQAYMGGTAPSYMGGSLHMFSTNAVGNDDVLLRIGNGAAHLSSAVSIYVVNASIQAPATATTDFFSFRTVPSTVASAFTLTNLYHYAAISTTKGAGSTITSVFGFYAGNAIATGSNNSGFYSTINTAANTYQVNMSGTATSFFGGPVGILTDVGSTTPATVFGIVGTHPGTAGTLQGVNCNITAPSTTTATLYNYRSNAGTAAAAFTLPDLVHYAAVGSSLGAGSTITRVKGFWALNAIAVGVNNYGFFSDIASATTTWQLYMSGTAPSYFAAPVSIGTNAPGDSLLRFAGAATTGNTAVYTIFASTTVPATTTSSYTQNYSIITTAASAFSIGFVNHFAAIQTVQGAGSTITNVRCFYAANAAAVGGTNYGYHSDINNATTTYQFYAGGTAQSVFVGPVGIGTANVVDATNTNGTIVLIGGNGTHPATTTNTFAIRSDYTAPSTVTASARGYDSILRTAAVAFTVTDITHFSANTTVTGAGSSATNVYGFRALSSIAPVSATNVYGFHSALVAATGVWAFYGAGAAASFFGGVVNANAAVVEKEVTVTYSASMTIDASTGNEQVITATNATAFTINAPTNPATGQYLEVTIRNTSGGALGVATWNAAFKMTAWTQPATAFSRTIIFRYNGTNWVEKGRTAADVPN